MNVLLLLIRSCVDQFHSRRASIPDAHASIFGGIDQGRYTDTDYEYDFEEEDSLHQFHRKYSQYSNYRPSYEESDPSAQAESVVDWNARKIADLESVVINEDYKETRPNNIRSKISITKLPALRIVEDLKEIESKGNRHQAHLEGPHSSRFTNWLKGGQGPMSAKIRISCEKLTSVSYPKGRQLVNLPCICTVFMHLLPFRARLKKVSGKWNLDIFKCSH